MPRNFKEGWLQAYRRYIVRQESPAIFHLWVGIAMISGALRRNVWIDRSTYKIRPNQYIILVSDSATSRKSVAMELGLDLLLANKSIRAVHERATVEGLIDLMSEVLPSPSGKIRQDGSVVLHADELSNLFNKKHFTEDLVIFLTAAYTGKAKLDFLTRNKGFVKVRNVCPVLLAGTTPGQFGLIFPTAILSSGFLGRTLIISGHSTERFADPKIDYSMRPGLIEDLRQISMLEGEVKLSKACASAFKEWYEGGKMGESFCAEMEPFYGRKHDHVLKCAMHLSISESDEMVITEDHFWMGVQLIEAIEEGMASVLERVGAVPISDISDLIVATLKRHRMPMLHSVLYRRMYRRIGDAKNFNDIIDSLIQQDKIEIVLTKKGTFYSCKEIKKGK